MGKVTFTIKDGKLKVDADGFAGESCLQATRPFLERLGIPEAEKIETLKPEYYQNTTVEVQAGQ